MPKFFKKDQKIPLKVVCHLSQLLTKNLEQGLANKDFRVEFNRGNNERFISDTVKFVQNENGQYVIVFDELPFVCTSSFFITKKGSWKEKICEFKLMVLDETSKSKFRPVAAKKYDMSQLLNNQPEIKGDLQVIHLSLNDDMTMEFQMSISVTEETSARKLSMANPNFQKSETSTQASQEQSVTDVKISADTDGLSGEELAQKVAAFSRQVNQLMQEKARLYKQIESKDEVIDKQTTQIAKKDQNITNLKN